MSAPDIDALNASQWDERKGNAEGIVNRRLLFFSDRSQRAISTRRNSREPSVSAARVGGIDARRQATQRRQATRASSQLLISSDHFFVFLSVLTTFAPELSDSRGQN
jgi:hypothetical protein